MFKHYFDGISGIEVYPIFLLIVFLTFFVIMTISLVRASKAKMDELGRIPFESEPDETFNR